ncbi:MAG: thioredoxin domain-containing protein [Alphaproteobacteria bacterium]
MIGVRLGVVAAFILIAIAGSGLAAQKLAFDEARFAATQQANRPILVEISAPWCTVCKLQKPIIERLAAKPEFKDLTIFEVDFDTQKDAVRALGAHSQSTLIAFRGTTETGRSVGNTHEGSIEALARSALQ